MAVKWRERCPRCGSTNITGRGWDTADGDEDQERGCYDCHHSEGRLRSEGGVSWAVQDPPPHRGFTATDVERTLRDEIYAAPDDDGVRSIYADWLIERGDPLGTFIALQLGRVARRDPVVSAEEQAMLDAQWTAWVGEIAIEIDAPRVEFERGFWSACDLFNARRFDDRLADHVAWSTVRRLVIGPWLVALLPRLLAGPLRRSLRSLLVPNRAAIDEVVATGVGIEELVLAFDTSGEPPSLAPLARLPRLRTLGVHCLGEFAARWVERAADAGLHELTLITSPHGDDLHAALRAAKRSRLVHLAIEVRDVVLHAARDADDTFAIRSVEVRPSHRDPREELVVVKHKLDALARLVELGIKVTMPVITPELAQYADGLGIKLVRAATRFAAKPSSG